MNETKWATLFVLALFVTSIVPVVAAEEGSDKVGMTLETEAKTEVKGRMNNDAFEKAREELKTRAEAQREELKSKRLEARAKVETGRKNLRELQLNMKEEFKVDQERLKALREEYKEKRQEFREMGEKERKALSDIRGDLRKCGRSDTPECKDIRAKVRGQATSFLSHKLELIIGVLGEARVRVEDNADAVAEIDALVAETAAAQAIVATLDETITKEELKEASQIVKEIGHKARAAIKKGVGKKASQRIGGIIEKMNHLSRKFDRMIERLEAQGKDTGAAEAKNAEFNAKLDAAAKLHAEAKTLFESGDHAGAAEKIRAAHAEIKTAHQILMGLMHEIRGIGGSDVLEEESEEAEEETEASQETSISASTVLSTSAGGASTAVEGATSTEAGVTASTGTESTSTDVSAETSTSADVMTSSEVVVEASTDTSIVVG